MQTVYLAGLINTQVPASLTWRTRATGALRGHFHVLSPLRGKEDLEQVSADGGITCPGLTSKDIILRDFNDVCNADILLVCLDDFGGDRPLVGTLFELAWAWYFNKTVVAFGDGALYRHPFVQEAICHWFPTLPQACLFLLEQHVV